MSPTTKSEAGERRAAKPPDGGFGWVIVASSFLIHAIIDGLTYAFGVLAAELVDQLGSSRQLNGWIVSLLIGVTLGVGPVSGIACDRFGARPVAIAGALIASVGFGVSYFATQPWMLLLSISLLAGFGIGLIYLPSIVCVGVYFEKRRSTAIGIAICGSGLGLFTFGPLINYLIDEYTWRGAMLILSGIVLNCAVLCSLLRPLEATVETETTETTEPQRPQTTTDAIQRSPSDFLSLQNLQHRSGTSAKLIHHHQRASSMAAISTSEGGQKTQLQFPPSRSTFVTVSAINLASAAPTGRRQMKLGRLLCNRAFMLLCVSNLLFNVGYDAPFLFAPDRARLAGYTASKGSLLLSVIGIHNLIGRLAFGFVSDVRRVNKLALYASSLIITGVSLFFSFISSAYAFMAVYYAVFGIFVGAYIVLTPVVLADMLGAENLNDSLGLTLLFQGLGVLAGPPMAGAIFDHTQSFNISYMTCGGCMILSGAMLLPLPCLLRWQAANGKEEKVSKDLLSVELHS